MNKSQMQALFLQMLDSLDASEPPQPPAAPATFQRPRFKQRERTDLPRQTYYVDSERHTALQYWGLIDGRAISEIVREAIDGWVQARELTEAQQGEP